MSKKLPTPAPRIAPLSNLRLGLCCLFSEQPIRFRTTTATACSRLEPAARREKLAELCRFNAAALYDAIECCARLGIGSFRINSQLLPIKTHPAVGYDLQDLPGGDAIVDDFRRCGRRAAELGVRTTFHPDQFVVLSSPRDSVVENSIAEIEYQSEVAEWVGADVVNIHAGGAYDSRNAALDRFARSLGRLSPRARERLTVENDDNIYAVAELLPLCRRESLPLVYDVHHHRCHGDGLSIEEASELAAATWNREPLFHISSPKEGWDGPACHRHHDYIDVADFPTGWLGQRITVEIEAKAKELAVSQLQRDLGVINA
ncbi:MAG: UV DNA damage repair endonuclease UvsE [Pirellulales bacterium]|nr:UV DNA damage repair endonuclease UvsE [Pirellulales bacterium]